MTRAPDSSRRPVEDGIADNVRRYRTEAGLSVADLAARVGISKAMLSMIEHAQTSCSLTTSAGWPMDKTCRSLPRSATSTSSERPSSCRPDTARGPHKRMEAVLVTLINSSELVPLFQHAAVAIEAVAVGHRADVGAYRRRDR